MLTRNVSNQDLSIDQSDNHEGLHFITHKKQITQERIQKKGVYA